MIKKKLTLNETFILAFENHKKNNFKNAENLYKEVLKMNPNHFESILHLGTLLGQTNNPPSIEVICFIYLSNSSSL